jgi:hypothetical protein
MEIKKYHNDGTILKLYRKIIERDKIGSKKIYDLWPSWLDTGTSIKICGVKLVLLAQISPPIYSSLSTHL